MGRCGLGLAVIATLCLLIASDVESARAGSPAALAATHSGMAAAREAGRERPLPAAHFRKSQSFYCYPRNYWWFYRPYTTAEQGYARCMPYFHYLGQPDGRRGANPDRAIK
jgi:hypothetical protein